MPRVSHILTQLFSILLCVPLDDLECHRSVKSIFRVKLIVNIILALKSAKHLKTNDQNDKQRSLYIFVIDRYCCRE